MLIQTTTNKTNDRVSQTIKTTISLFIAMHSLCLLGCVSFLILSYKGKNRNNNECIKENHFKILIVLYGAFDLEMMFVCPVYGGCPMLT